MRGPPRSAPLPYLALFRSGGLDGMAKMRKVNVVNGYGKFTGANTIAVEGDNGTTTVTFDNAIIAAGSQPVNLPFIQEDRNCTRLNSRHDQYSYDVF